MPLMKTTTLFSLMYVSIADFSSGDTPVPALHTRSICDVIINTVLHQTVPQPILVASRVTSCSLRQVS